MGYNFFLNSTLIGMWYLLFQGERKPALWQKIAYPLTALLIFGMLLLSDGRSGFFMGLAIILFEFITLPYLISFIQV